LHQLVVMTMLLVLAIAGLTMRASASKEGVLQLDKYTFDKVMNLGLPTLLKFDKEYPYGDDEDQWTEFAKNVGELGPSNSVLLTEVGVGEYGEKANEDIAKEFKVDSEKYPEYFLIKDGDKKNFIKFDGDKTSDGLALFMRENAGLYIGLPGQVEEMEGFTGDFLKDKEGTLKRAEAALSKLSESEIENGKFYVRVMKKVIEKGVNFVKTEKKRVKKLVDSKSTSTKKKEMFKKRINILSSFKDEL